jgi:isopentenyl-diphosphate Delta-isomerase
MISRQIILLFINFHRNNSQLSILSPQIRPENLHYLTRIHYQDKGNGVWGEHELDYILFLQKDVDIKPNPNEVSEILYLQREKIDE